MLSLVLYGRNDNHGYNLHKRAALSLNCMAEMLTGAGDEILFVDYNTPNDLPTFPEAIQDTLTEKTKRRLRIFRVRPAIHERFRPRTHLLTIEPVSRNVAIRRSNPSNRWVLSSNTDIIFVLLRQRSLTQIVQDLPEGFYGAPRIGLPDSLWESLDRLNPSLAIETIRDWGTTLHLNELIRGPKPVLYDNPGDFQLMRRRDLFENHGFDEDMVLGWHVDSNIFKRLGRLYNSIGDLAAEVYGYHCDHTRQVTAIHAHPRRENDWDRFVDNVVRPDKPEQADEWGCANDDIEEIRLTGTGPSAYVGALRKVLGAPLEEPPVVTFAGETFNLTDYDPRHVLPFLSDFFACSKRDIDIGWFGCRAETLCLFADIWQELGFTGQILLERGVAPIRPESVCPGTRFVGLDEIVALADTFVFDFAPPDSHSRRQTMPVSIHAALVGRWRKTVDAERAKTESPSRRFLALNAINNAYEGIVCADIAAAATPFSSRSRHGYVLKPDSYQARIEGLEARVNELQRVLLAMQNSTSWRLTAPLRALGGWLASNRATGRGAKGNT